MANLLLSNSSLKNFIESLKLSEEQKSFFLEELPGLNEKERLELLDTLKEIYLLNEEENGAIEKINKNWE